MEVRTLASGAGDNELTTLIENVRLLLEGPFERQAGHIEDCVQAQGLLFPDCSTRLLRDLRLGSRRFHQVCSWFLPGGLGCHAFDIVY